MTASDVPTPASPPAQQMPGWLRLLPVLVLVIAIAAQATLMGTVNIDRQTGSGFAMFSSVDFAGSRSVVVTASFNSQTVELTVPDALDHQLAALRYSPTNSRAQDLAMTLAQNYRWDEQDGRVLGRAAGQPTGNESSSVSNVSVVVRALTADGQKISSRVLAQGSSQ